MKELINISDQNIYQKLVEVRKSVPYLKKENNGQQYSYVSSSQVMSAVRKKMDETGLIVIPRITDKNVVLDTVEKKDKYGNAKHTTTYFTELKITYEIVNVDNPDEKIQCPFYAQGVDIAGEKGVGKALTYGEKYFFLKLFNVATDKDDPDYFQRKTEGSETQLPQYRQSNVMAMSTHTATKKQIGLIRGLWSGAGGKNEQLGPYVNKKFNKPLEKLTSREASGFIKMLQNKQKTQDKQDKGWKSKPAVKDPFSGQPLDGEGISEDMPF